MTDIYKIRKTRDKLNMFTWGQTMSNRPKWSYTGPKEANGDKQAKQDQMGQKGCIYYKSVFFFPSKSDQGPFFSQFNSSFLRTSCAF